MFLKNGAHFAQLLLGLVRRVHKLDTMFSMQDVEHWQQWQNKNGEMAIKNGHGGQYHDGDQEHSSYGGQDIAT